MKSSGSRWSSISRILVVTTLVLVLLLTVAVSAVIYLAVGQQSSGIAQPEFVRHGILQSYDEVSFVENFKRKAFYSICEINNVKLTFSVLRNSFNSICFLSWNNLLDAPCKIITS